MQSRNGKSQHKVLQRAGYPGDTRASPQGGPLGDVAGASGLSSREVRKLGY